MTVQKDWITECGDPNTKFGKYFVFRTQPNPFHPEDNPDVFQVYLDERAVDGGMYFSGGMVTKKPPVGGPTAKPHYHDYIEYLIMLSTDPNDQNNLGGEFFMYIEDEKHVYDKACVITIPAKVWHCPFGWNRVDRPILFYSCSNAPRLYDYLSRDPKWDNVPDPDNKEMVREPEPGM